MCQKLEDNINSGVAKLGDTLGSGGSGGSGGDASYSCSFKNTKAFIVGNAQKNVFSMIVQNQKLLFGI